MSRPTIRNLNATIKERLGIHAAEHSHSAQAEASGILENVVKAPDGVPPPNLYERIRARLAPLGGADDLAIPPREPGREPPHFD